MEIPPIHCPGSRVALGQNCVNYHQGTPPPHPLGVFGADKQASMEDIPGGRHQYCLKFSVEEMIPKQVTANCTAEVLYPPDTAPEITFTFEGEIGKSPDEEDNAFY